MGATYGQNDQFGAKTGLVAPNWWNSVGQWGKQARAKPRWCNGTISQVSNGHWGVCGPQKSLLWSPWVLWSILWLTITLSYTKNYSNILPELCLYYIQPWLTLFHQIGATRPTYGQKRTFLASLDPLCGPLMPLDGPLWPTKLLQSTTPVVPWLVPSPLFQTVSPYCSHKTCLWPIKVIFGGPLIV